MKRLKFLSCILVVVLLMSTFVGVNVSAASQMDGSWSEEFTLSGWSDEHVYDVSFTTDGLWNCTVMASTSSLTWELRDLAGNRLKAEYLNGGTALNPVSEPINTVISGGSYKLVITGAEGAYKFANTFTGYNVQDQNAISMSSPQACTIGVIMSGAITINDTEDWFTFSVPSDGNYVLTFMTSMQSLDWELYNSSFAQIKFDYVNGGSEATPMEQKTQLSLDAGTYYLKATDSYYHGVYVFAVENLTSAACSHSYSYKYVSPTYFKKGYTIKTCTSCGDKVKESYRAAYKMWLSNYLWRRGSRYSISWGKVTGAKGYQLCYAKKKSFKGAKKILIKGKSKTETYVKGLKRGKSYYFRIRPFKKSGKKKVFGAWSDIKYFKKIS